VVLHFAKKRNTVMHRYVSVLVLLLSVIAVGLPGIALQLRSFTGGARPKFFGELEVYPSGGFLEPA
jgi:hypothetical protein